MKELQSDINKLVAYVLIIEGQLNYIINDAKFYNKDMIGDFKELIHKFDKLSVEFEDLSYEMFSEYESEDVL